MERIKLTLIVILLLSPVLAFGGVGAWVLWKEGHLYWLTWVLPVCWMLAWILIRSQKRIRIPLPQIGSKEHWTPKDHEARAIVEREEKRLENVTYQQLTDTAFYQKRTMELATALARHYHPNISDPLDELSVVEIIAVAQLVTEDMEEWFQTYVPGSHLVTVKWWRRLSKLPDIWKATTNLGWVASVALNPVGGLGRLALSKVFVDPVSKELQTGVIGSFYVMYIRQVGFYLIELNSGRLRGGSLRYRQTMQRLQPTTQVPADDPKLEPVTVTIAVVGQVKAGKSSLVNCLLGQRQAATDVLPLTKDVNRYQLTLDDESSDRLVLLDTAGYNDAGATQEQVATTIEAVRQADLVLLVMAATSPAKQADAKMLSDLTQYFHEKHQLKPPPVVGVVSRIDGLSPVMEWSPPYDWENPVRPKEIAIRDAIHYANEAVGSGLAGVVPVCAARDRGHVLGVEEWLLPLITVLLDEARAVSLVRNLHSDFDRNRLLKVKSQFQEAGERIQTFVTRKIVDFLK